MRQPPNKLWAFGPFISILLVAAAYYIKVPAFRDAVDTRFPWVKEHFAQYVPAPEVVMIKDPPADVIPSSPGEPSETHVSPPSAARQPVRTSPPVLVPATEPHENGLSLQAFSANRSLWPKTVTLRRTIEFPAVLDGRVIGKTKAPAGTEANLVMINGLLLGVEFRGGGAWVPISQTDLAERARITSR
jgi:hypothetical protein